MLNYFVSLLSALQSYRASHTGLSPDAIVIGEQIYKNLKEEVNLNADSYEWKDDEFENIPLIVNEYETLWHFEGVAPLEHIRCCLCDVVLEKNHVRGHNLDEGWMCECCYDRIMRNMGIMNEQRQKIVRENNERVAQTMDKNYFEAYKEMLFGDAANGFNFNSKE